MLLGGWGLKSPDGVQGQSPAEGLETKSPETESFLLMNAQNVDVPEIKVCINALCNAHYTLDFCSVTIATERMNDIVSYIRWRFSINKFVKLEGLKTLGGKFPSKRCLD